MQGGEAAGARGEMVDHGRLLAGVPAGHLHGQDRYLCGATPPAVHGAGAHGGARCAPALLYPALLYPAPLHPALPNPPSCFALLLARSPYLFGSFCMSLGRVKLA